LDNTLAELGTNKELLMAVYFIQLAVIPKLKITNNGIVDVEKQTFVDLFV